MVMVSGRYQLVNLPAPNDCSEEADLSHCICGRCQNVLKDPIQTRPCRHRFCRTCFQAHMVRWRELRCRSLGFQRFRVVVNRLVDQ